MLPNTGAMSLADFRKMTRASSLWLPRRRSPAAASSWPHRSVTHMLLPFTQPAVAVRLPDVPDLPVKCEPMTVKLSYRFINKASPCIALSLPRVTCNQ